ncbi:MAG: EAL domain-containing protein [Betaproteobacteria bacterium]
MQAMVRKTTSSDTQIGARATLHAGFDRIYAGIPKGRGWASYPFNTLTLGSHFQPIFSVAEQRCVAYEGLLCANNLMGQAMRPETVFAVSANQQEELFLDFLCRALHLRNFSNLSAPGDLVFLNAYPETAIEDPHHPQVFANMMEFYGVSPKNVVVEILETGVSDEAQLVDAARLYRKLGCRIAIDDFGIGFSNFDRLWRLRPDFVKIDRSVTVSAVRETHARLVFANMVKLIHECGAQVIVEGVETRDEALVALEAGADFVQGYYFARPGLAAVPKALCDNMFAGLMKEHRPVAAAQDHAPNIDLDIYAHALNLAILDLQRGATFARATESFLALPRVLRICLATADAENTPSGSMASRLILDMIEVAPGSRNYATSAGAEIGTSLPAASSSLEQLHQVLQQALAAPHQVHITTEADPDAARTAGALTLSCAFELEQRMVVLCGDLVDRRHRGERSTILDGGLSQATSEGNNESTRSTGKVIRLHL